jgi:uncharacterized membrane protein (UPF0127 family)
MYIKVLRTREEQDLGLQYLPRLPDNTIYIFIGPFLAGQFHSQNVPEPFDLIFLSAALKVMSRHRLDPPHHVVPGHFDAMYAVEAKAGLLDKFFVEG